MKYCNILLSALATLMTLTGIMPCGACAADAVRAASLGHNQAVAHRVYEEGFNLGRFEVPCSPGFVGHGSTATFTHADGMAEVKGFREALHGRWAHCRGMAVRHSHGLMKPLGMLPTPATGSATGGSPADGTAR